MNQYDIVKNIHNDKNNIDKFIISIPFDLSSITGFTLPPLDIDNSISIRLNDILSNQKFKNKLGSYAINKSKIPIKFIK